MHSLALDLHHRFSNRLYIHRENGPNVCVLLFTTYKHCRTEFYGIEVWVLQRAIQALAREGKAELIQGESADGSDAGVKFFS